MFSTSKLLLSSSSSIVATGGSVTYDGAYVIHTFASNDTFTIIKLGIVNIEYLIVAGGGGGGKGTGSGIR